MYSYKAMKPEIFKEENQKEFLSVRGRVHELLKEAGAVRLQNVFLTVLDRLVELGEIKELKRDCMAQEKVFISS